MSFAQDDSNPYAAFGAAAAHAPADARAAFLSKTYLHLGGAVAAFVSLETIYFRTLPIEDIAIGMMSVLGPWTWLVVLGAFMLVSFVAERMAHSATSLGTQYAGLGLYVVAQSIIFIPLLWLANQMEGVLPTAAVLTLLVFTGLTAVVFVTKKNFGFLAPALTIGSLVLLGVIVMSIILGNTAMLGLFISAGGVLLMSGYILYYTSQVLHEYRTDQYVAASLALFAALATLFWYMIRLVMYIMSATQE